MRGLLLALACTWVACTLAGCGKPAAGERELVRYWDGPDRRERVRGREILHEGKWVQDGLFQHFDRAGNVIAEGRMHLGLEQGPWRQTFDDGGSGSGVFEGGKREGRWEYFHPEGTRYEEGSYRAGQREGRWIRWYPDGKTLHAEIEYVAGERHGRVVVYRSDGTVDPAASGTYDHGEKVQ